jgi:hypothetical protein
MKHILLGLLVVVLMLSAGTPAMARRVRVAYVPVYPVYRTYAARVYYPRRVYYPVYATPVVEYYPPAVVVPY